MIAHGVVVVVCTWAALLPPFNFMSRVNVIFAVANLLIFIHKAARHP